MDARLRTTLEELLRDRRAALLERAAEEEADLAAIEADHTAELVERGQHRMIARLLARLDDQTRREIHEIDTALGRMRAGDYGRCSACGDAIPAARLRSLPATALCRRCAEQAELWHVAHSGRPVAQPLDLNALSNREIEELVRRAVREHRSIDDENLYVHYRRGVMRLDGTLTAEAHERLRALLEETFGFREIVDRVEIVKARA